MDDEIDEAALAAMLADDEDDQEQAWTRQADVLSSVESIEFNCSPVDTSPATGTKDPSYRFSDVDIGKLLGSKTSTYVH
jgi:hypothetical protein